MKNTMWLHDEQREISLSEVNNETVICPICGKTDKKYIRSWYSGNTPCIIKASFCGKCGARY